MIRILAVTVAWLLALPAIALAGGMPASATFAKAQGQLTCPPWWAPANGYSESRTSDRFSNHWRWFRPQGCGNAPGNGGEADTENPVTDPPGMDTNGGDSESLPAQNIAATPPSLAVSSHGSTPSIGAAAPQSGALNTQSQIGIGVLPVVSGDEPSPVVSPDGTISLAVGYRLIPMHEVSLCADGTLGETCDSRSAGSGVKR